MKETILRKVSVRDPDGVPGIITYGLEYIQGNAQSHWAVTAWFCGFDQSGHKVEYGGCCHDVILRLRPELAPFVALHLSDADGAPMHAVANGWYAMAGAMGGAGETYHAGNGKVQHWKPDGSFDGYRESTPDECLIQCADHLRITRQQAANLRDECLALVTHADPESFGYKNDCQKAKKHFEERVNAMRPRWARESAEALKLLQATPKTLYDRLREAGVTISNHESDLYFPRTDASRAILAEFPLQKSNATLFVNQAPPNVGEVWFDVPFAYDPFWQKRGMR